MVTKEREMNKPLCIYHANCLDGFGAAYAVWKRYRDDVDYYPATYGTEIPAECVKDKDVFMVDFSCKKDVILGLNTLANSITVIDHHKSAEEELKELLERGTIGGIFDMNKSGAVLTWEWFHPEERVPSLLQHIQDRDLWNWELKDTKEITMALMSYDMDFMVWDGFFGFDDASRLLKLTIEGDALVRKFDQDIKQVIKNPRRLIIGGYDVPAINANYIFASEAGNILSEGEYFAAIYNDSGEERRFSLRSKEGGGIDVALIAQKYGGGGHKHAAGFSVPINRLASLGLL